MLLCVELYVAVDFDPDALLTPETRRETGARIFTREGAIRAGLGGLPEPRAGGDVRYILVEAAHRRWIERALEANHAVDGYDVHEVG